MCGIFGISKKNLASNDLNKILEDIKIYTNSSQKRGSDTFGVSIKLESEVVLYKANEKPILSLKKKIIKNF